MYLITNELREIKNETNSFKTDLSREVLVKIQLMNFFIEYLKRIADLKISQ